MSPPIKENLKNHFRKKKTGNVSPESVQCHKPSWLQSPLKDMNTFREEFVSNIRKTSLACVMLRLLMRTCKSEME